MAERAIDVVVSIGQENVFTGRLYSHRAGGRESASFSYEASYLARQDAYALDPSLPLVQGGLQTPVGLSMFRAFADAAPDRWGRALIRRAEGRRAVAEGGTARSLGEVDFLLGVRDDLRQGALRFRDPDTGAFLADDDSGVPHVTGLARLLHAAEHLERDEESEDELRDLLRGGSSLGGARPKAHVIDNAGRIAIAKFPSSKYDEWDVAAWEGVALDLARQAGIRVPTSDVIRVADRNVLVVDRFDREGDRRIGYVSAITMLEASDGEQGSYLDIASVIEQQSPQATDDLHELWRRVAFSILISNTDDHLRNHGFLHAGGTAWSLSPAFDLNPDPQPGSKHLRTAIDGTETAASVRILMSVAPLFRLNERAAARVLAEVLTATRRWREIAAACDVPQTEVDRMAWAFEHPETELAQDITGG
ncbi:MAG: type II toxin-antitoxin system HipA family toxin [Actinobacteria bacterium]|nr:type II toxin-antitoxin system HipA family toxin [Actinomycetota bacterium]